MRGRNHPLACIDRAWKQQPEVQHALLMTPLGHWVASSDVVSMEVNCPDKQTKVPQQVSKLTLLSETSSLLLPDHQVVPLMGSHGSSAVLPDRIQKS